MISLHGPRGAGKSTLGRALAERLSRPFYDLDAELERRAGRPLAVLFTESEPKFRDLEESCLAEILASGPRDLVIALGGGAVLRERSRVALARTVRIYLFAAPDVLRQRLRHAGVARPSLTGADPLLEIEAVLAQREPIYRAASDGQLDTSASTFSNSVEGLTALVQGLLSLEQERGTG